MNVQNVVIISDIFESLVTALAIILGGIWSYWNFVIKRQSIWNLQLFLEPEILTYNSGQRLLVVYVVLKNTGQVKVIPGPKGCRISIWEIPKNKEKGNQIFPKEGKVLLKNIDILRKYKEKGGYWKYEIEPNCLYQEVEAITVMKGDLLGIEVKFYPPEDDDFINETKIIKVN